MMPQVDYVLSPSSYVTRSFLEHGFKREQILRNVYPVNLDCFRPATEPRPKNRPLTIICTGAPSLRKGTPYLLEAFRLIRRSQPTARLLLISPPHPSLAYALEKFRDLPIEWGPNVPHPQLAERLRGADVFALPSLEDGFALTVTEALACGLPAVLTPNTGASDLIQPGVNGEIVPIRDAAALAAAILKLADKILGGRESPSRMIDPASLSFECFEEAFLAQLVRLNLLQQ
jgi:glycosyltransferase involved in cell wall biosynthesis